MRAMIAAALLLVPFFAAASVRKTSDQWVTAVPEKSGLPTVEVSLGYPGGYIPRGFVPIALRARGADRPFEGTIGFRFAIRGQRSFDMPVVSRVDIGPGQTWSFSTWGRIPNGDRELEIEWRDPSLRLLAAVRTLAIPLHVRRVLRVIADQAASPPATALGSPIYSVTIKDLSDEAQWYMGFRAIALPTELWLDLPAGTRSAIFGSGIFVVFVGTPRAGQTLDAEARALLPVSFESRPATVNVPWPYALAGRDRVTTSMAVKPVAGASIIGNVEAPFVVSTTMRTAAWVAVEGALDRPLPAFEVTSLARDRHASPSIARPSLQQLVRNHVAMIATILVAVLTILLWLQSRRTPRWIVMALALIVTMIVVAADQRIRPMPDTHEVEIITPLGPGMVDHYRATYVGGRRPLDEAVRPKELARTSINGMDDIYRTAEVRRANTPAGAGSLYGSGDYEAVLRWTSRREVGTAPAVRVRSCDAEKLTLEYESPEPVNEIVASWSVDGKRHSGGIVVDGEKRGTATIRSGVAPWPETSWFSGMFFRGYTLAMGERLTKGIEVSLVHRTRRATKQVRWSQPLVRTNGTEPLKIDGTLRAASPDTLSGLFVLPAANRIPRGPALVAIPTRVSVASITLRWPSGNGATSETSADASSLGARGYEIPVAILHRIVESGGVFEVAVQGRTTVPAESNATIELWEKNR